uniref:Squalene monooxygenase n=1 Tax=Polytomella parva TaxID=51329 RepID=A0A7S0YK51_9CHLO|mmetsp:Transcript_30486/g.55630  ORF Transcript_30486/g.55630 Transcript_30486/m.55630 type:complete len:516 (+) Transcript_30486:131-1678(+)|eukprot:CAMPEP_0175070786 /NCGR_PEP_ID=MMETSP0052_2-20121109/18898_1 /TAXON_ID=51329 ORGANISM="Polytomella parva, Strain SAG 63-3" /NCGR_SAMPLE_ID=MMETSP0052_2 /ASSEMBLY_ACC=CAM_ASM_000194 /LENGTH=515 /DNA_ID=CAMNT_0016337919 /DNA_START=97 /DNA_END=1644 /DNA_ORIENTATION=-
MSTDTALDGPEDRETPIPPVSNNVDYASDPEIWDVIIVGAGIAGCALAHSLGKDGRRVLLLERDLRQPDRIVGELLQPGGYLALRRLGLEKCCEGIDAQRVQGYALFKDGKEAVIKYPVEGYDAEVAGRSFHHGRFIQRLRAAASEQSHVTIRQALVKKLVNDDLKEWTEGEVVRGVLYKSADGEERTATAYLTVVCDGMYSPFRNRLSQVSVVHPSFFVGVLLRDVQLPFPGHGHVILASTSPVLFYPVSSTEVRCLVDIPAAKLPEDLPKYFREVVAPQVPEKNNLRNAFLEAIARPGALRAMQNKQLTCTPLHPPGALLLGDAFNMRHPLTGGGMTVAFNDCNLLADLLRPLASLSDPFITAAGTESFYTRRKPVSATINTLANALYKVFCPTKGQAEEAMRQACFDYLALGGIYSSGPIGLLSGLNPSPSVLVMHFFMVALYGVGRELKPVPTFAGLKKGVSLLMAASKIILPIIWTEGIRAVFFPFWAPKPGPAAVAAAKELEMAKAKIQ